MKEKLENQSFEQIAMGAFLLAAAAGLVVWLSGVAGTGIAGIATAGLIVLLIWMGLILVLV